MNACVENIAPNTLLVSHPAATLPNVIAGARQTFRTERASAAESIQTEQCSAQEGSEATLSGKCALFLSRWLGLGSVHATEKLPRVVHVVIDAFFASAEQVLNPGLRGKPVVVGGCLVASASHEAMLRGVEAGMGLGDALRLCPEAIVVSGAYERYAEFAEHVGRILERYTPKVAPGALDDFYLDFAGAPLHGSDYETTLHRLQAEILGQTGLHVSIGAARTRIVAAMASQQHRQPGSLRIITAGIEGTFLAPLSVDKLHGIGRAEASALAERGVMTIGQLRLIPKPVLVAAFGDVIGRQIWEHAHGQDRRETLLRSAPKSVTRETTIKCGTVDQDLLSRLVGYLSGRISRALRESGMQPASIGVRLCYMDDYCAHQTKRLASAINNERELFLAAKELCTQLFTRSVPIRQLGITISKVNEGLGRDALLGAKSNFRTDPKHEMALSTHCLSN
jgi:DNA polymerase-4